MSTPAYINSVEMAKVEQESINFKLPKPLATALRAAAKERDTTATDLVIQGLNPEGVTKRLEISHTYH